MTIIAYAFTNADDDKTYQGEFDTEMYFTTANDIKEYILKDKIKFWNDFNDDLFLDIKDKESIAHFIHEIEHAIETNKVMPRFIVERQAFNCVKARIENLIKSLPNYLEKRIERYNSEYQELVLQNNKTKQSSWNCLKNNWTEIKEFLLSLAVDKAEQAKLRLKVSQAKYYQKKKALLGIESKPKLTPEEKAERYKEQLKKANKTYYEKKRAELIELGVMKPKQTEEERRMAKKEANKRYYESKLQKQQAAEQEELEA